MIREIRQFNWSWLRHDLPDHLLQFELELIADSINCWIDALIRQKGKRMLRVLSIDQQWDWGFTYVDLNDTQLKHSWPNRVLFTVLRFI